MNMLFISRLYHSLHEGNYHCSVDSVRDFLELAGYDVVAEHNPSGVIVQTVETVMQEFLPKAFNYAAFETGEDFTACRCLHCRNPESDDDIVCKLSFKAMPDARLVGADFSYYGKNTRGFLRGLPLRIRGEKCDFPRSCREELKISDGERMKKITLGKLVDMASR